MRLFDVAWANTVRREPSLLLLSHVQMDPGPHMLRAVAAAMAERASDCIPQEISNTVWAFAKLRARSAYPTTVMNKEHHPRLLTPCPAPTSTCTPSGSVCSCSQNLVLELGAWSCCAA